jgi:cytochrome c oxidase subunit 2
LSVIPAVVLAGLIFMDFAWTNIMFVDEDEDTIVIELYAQQFNWKARYSGNDNVLGKMLDLLKVLIGVDLADPYAQDDIVVTTFQRQKNLLR